VSDSIRGREPRRGRDRDPSASRATTSISRAGAPARAASLDAWQAVGALAGTLGSPVESGTASARGDPGMGRPLGAKSAAGSAWFALDARQHVLDSSLFAAGRDPSNYARDVWVLSSAANSSSSAFQVLASRSSSVASSVRTSVLRPALAWLSISRQV